MARRPAAALLLLSAFVAGSRAWFWTGHAPNFDFANFALGVVRFAPENHQPHPPGYPGVILAARAFAAWGLGPVRALQCTALAGSLAALAGAWMLGRRLGGQSGGLWAATVLAVHPIFWYSGVTSPARVFLAAGVCWFFYWLAGLPAGLWPAVLTLAVLAGFRPELPFLLAAPFILAARRAGLPWRKVLGAGAAALVLAAPWLVWLSASFGSLFRLVYVYYHYFLHHAGTTSPLLGAPAEAWHAQVRDALLWNGPVLLLALAGRPPAAIRPAAGAYLVPALALQVLFHLAPDAPDHTLGTTALLAVLAGAHLPARVSALAGLGFLAVSLAPPRLLPPDLDVLSLRSFAAAQLPAAQTISRLRREVQPSDAIVVLAGSPISHRLLGPEFPDIPIYRLDPGGGALLYRYRQTPLPPGAFDPARYRRIHTLPAGAPLELAAPPAGR